MTTIPAASPSGKPLTVGFFGAKGCGKTVSALQFLNRRKPLRSAVWDFKHDPALASYGTPFDNLGAMIERMTTPRFKLRYLVNHDDDIARQFDLFCRAAWAAGDLTVFVDEVPEVSKPGRAPPSWRKLVNIGREYRRADGKVVGVSIVAAGQRAAECDKSFIANLDITRAGRMGFEDDAKAVAKKIGCDWRELMTLPDLHYFERDTAAIAFQRGVLSFRKSASLKQKAAAKP